MEGLIRHENSTKHVTLFKELQRSIKQETYKEEEEEEDLEGLIRHENSTKHVTLFTELQRNIKQQS